MTKNNWTKLTPEPEPLTAGKKWHVFLSYRSVNRPWVLNLYDVLKARGYEVFLDQVALVGGRQLIGELKKNLKASQAGILVWSSAARDSKWVEKEYETMEVMATEDAGFQFVPVRLDDTELPGFADLHVFYDFSAYPDGPNGGELMRLLHAIVDRPLSEEAARFATDQDVAAKRTTAQINAAIHTGIGERLLQLFGEGGPSWEATAVLGCRVAEGLTKLGLYDEAIPILEKLHAAFPVAIRPQQLRALALARRGGDGDLNEAQLILAALEDEGHKDPETLGIYARTWMDRYALSKNVLHLKRSRNLYVEAFTGARDDYYTGINAAAKSVLIGTDRDIALGQGLARQVEDIVGTEPIPGDYWQTATVAEAQLIQGNHATAATRYGEAVEMAPTEEGSHGATWLQACRLMEQLQPPDEDRALVRGAFAHLPGCEETLAAAES